MFVVFFLLCSGVFGWQTLTQFAGTQLKSLTGRSQQSTLRMRDASASYWFKVGDAVRVVDDVCKASKTLRDGFGVVVETWEKCDVDPTCCCAEQVDIGMAVRVEFSKAMNTNNAPLLEIFSSIDSESFMHYFAEEELLKVSDQDAQTENKASTQDAPFDGMSCVAFKLEQLESHQKPRRIASFEPVRLDEGRNEGT
jgi:hypothetical protein